MSQVNPYAETQRGNGSPPPDDEDHGLLVPMIHNVTRQLSQLTQQVHGVTQQVHSVDKKASEAVEGVRWLSRALVVGFAVLVSVLMVTGVMAIAFR